MLFATRLASFDDSPATCYADKMNTLRKTILLLFGGESTEHEVSLMSAKNVYEALNKQQLDIILCYIDTAGKWWHAPAIGMPEQPQTSITPVLGASAVRIGNQQTNIDVIFPVLHGSNGEDGTVQGLARLLHTPIVGCGLDGSLLAIDKSLTKQLLSAVDIRVTPGITCRADTMPPFGQVAEKLGQVLFIKPARQGSSVGVSKAATEAEFTIAFAAAAKHDDIILIESAITDARELEVAVLGSTHNPQASIVGEVTPDRDFYDYESKYDNTSTSKVTIPADVSPELSERIRTTATAAYTALRCRGLARIDFFLSTDGTLYLNEVNTMPGFTNISMYPKLWEASGLPYKQLVASLIERAA